MTKQFKDDCFRISIVVSTAVLYCLALVWFLEPADIYAAGITGFSQIVKKLVDNLVEIPLGVYTLALNIPLFIYGWKKVSKRFSLFSIISVGVQSIMTLGWLPVVDFGLAPMENQLTFAIIGGLITGVACAVALRFGTSTGGLDILAQVLAIDKNISIGSFTMIANVSIAIVGGRLVSGSWPVALYSCIRIILSSVAIDKIHTSYNYVKLNIITQKSDEMITHLLALYRGVTIIPVEGAYSRQNKSDLIMVVSSYEMDKAVSVVKEYDPNAFIIVEPVKRLIGNYARKTIV